MKKIQVTLQREVVVEVFIDETTINKQTIDMIADHFDEGIYRTPKVSEYELSEYECGLYNYARSAAIVAAGIGDVEYIALDKGHTSANVKSDYLESEFEKIKTL